MIVRVFKAGISRGESPVNYLLSDRDHTGQPRPVAPEVLEGNPDLTVAIINNIQRKHKYVSGAIAFRDNEQPTREQMHEVIRSFKQTMCPGLGPENFNSLFVLHCDKGNTEIHFVVPMIEMTTGKRMNIHPPGQLNIQLYEAFTQVMNHRLGYAQVVPDPLKLALSDFERCTAEGKTDRSNKLYLHKRLTKAIRSGEVVNRDQLCEFLTEQFGVEITRKGQDYLSIKFPGSEKAKRFRGPLYNASADYSRLVQTARDAKHEHRLSPTEYRQAENTLTQLIEARRQFNIRAYLSPRMLRSQRMQMNRQLRQGNPVQPITITTKENPMIKKPVPTKTAARRQTETSSVTVPPAIRDRSAVLASIQSIREQAMSGSNATIATSDGIAEIIGSLGEIESGINAAISDMNQAKNPKQRAAAERRMIKLVEQKRRLEVQLGQAKARQLNRASKVKGK